MKRITIIVLFLFLGMHFAFAQGKTITGKVTSAADGSTIPGVQVVVKGTTIGVTTDNNGTYSLNVPQSATILEFSFIGMVKQEITIGNQTTINVVMEDDLFLLGEVIVVGYGTKGKNEITGSTVQIAGDQLAQIPVTSVDQALQGKVAGLSISTTSGSPGATQDIRIRGVGSLTAGNEPLFVIDGVPVVNQNFSGSDARTSLGALAALNSSDIESLTVLKDASATSAYGARGSNGVIVITTKRGKSGKTQFAFNSTYGFQNEAVEGRLALTGAQREELMLDALFNTYGTTAGFTRENALTYYLANTGRDNGKLKGWIDAGRPVANWNDVTDNKNAPILNLSISATGGDDVSSFYTSFSYLKQEATVINSSLERMTGTLNYSRNFRKNVKFSTNANVSNTRQNGILLEGSAYFANPRAGAFFFSPWIMPYDANGEPNLNTAGSNYNFLYLAKHDVVFNDLTRAISNSTLEWEIIKDLKFSSRISLDYHLIHYKNFQNRNYGDSEPENGTSFASIDRNFNSVAQNSLDYQWIYKDNHRFSFKALIEFQKNKRHYLSAYGENVPADGLTNVDNTSANYAASSNFFDWMNLSYLGMINYNYLGRYIADFTFRREGSSRFSSDLRFGSFWSAGAAWNMSQEDFLSDVEWISNLRLRASYGLSGSSAIGINGYQALLAYDANYADNGAVYPSQYGNINLTWEKNKNYDLGIDFGFFDNKVNGSVAYYHKRTYDLLQDVPLSRTTGHPSITQNIGAMVNKGVEFIVNVDIVRSSDLNVSANFNIGTVDNEVTELALDGNGEEIKITSAGLWRNSTGHAYREWYMKTWAGVDPANGYPLWYVDGIGGATTSVYADAAEYWQGKGPIPTYNGGFGAHVDYKGFFLDANMAFSGGNKIFENWARYTFNAGTLALNNYNGVQDLMDRWQKPGDITDVPRMSWDNGKLASNTSSRFLFDGDYMRLKDIVFGYDFPEAMISKLKISGLRAYVRGTNLWTWVKDKDLKYDPEVQATGFTGMTTPPIKSIVFGLNVKF